MSVRRYASDSSSDSALASDQGHAWSDTSSDSSCSSVNGEDDSWKYSAKCWTRNTWSLFDAFLLKKGYRLLCDEAFLSSQLMQEDENAFLEARKAALLDYEPYDCIRQARCSKRRPEEIVYIRAQIATSSSDHISALKLLNSRRLRGNPSNIAMAVLDVIEVTYADVDILFIVSADMGQPCYEVNLQETDTWRAFVLDLFEGLNFLHENGIAHLDIGPMNVLYDLRTRKPAFIDFEGCQLHEGPLAEAKVTEVRAISARLPEAGEAGFNPFASDVWELGDMLLQMEHYPDDDLTALFRFMCVREPKARPTMEYALQTLRCLLQSSSDVYTCSPDGLTYQ